MVLASILPFFYFNSCTLALFPTFPWAHNQEEATSLYGVVCNMKKLQMFDPLPWSTRFYKLYLLSRGLQNPVVHPLHGATQSNTSKIIF
jgi:hypothetical protein